MTLPLSYTITSYWDDWHGGTRTLDRIKVCNYYTHTKYAVFCATIGFELLYGFLTLCVKHERRSSLLAKGVRHNSVSEPIIEGFIKGKQILRWEQGLDEQGNKIKIRSSWMIVQFQLILLPFKPVCFGEAILRFPYCTGEIHHLVEWNNSRETTPKGSGQVIV